MSTIETEMTGHRPQVFAPPSFGRFGKHNLVIETTAGMLRLGLLPMQGRELADILIEAFGSTDDVLAELATDTT